MEKIDPKEFQKRLDLLSDILTGISQHADVVSQKRCPYKNRHNECTASFGCRNKRKSSEAGALPRCAGDDKLDYRVAWES